MKIHCSIGIKNLVTYNLKYVWVDCKWGVMFCFFLGPNGLEYDGRLDNWKEAWSLSFRDGIITPFKACFSCIQMHYLFLFMIIFQVVNQIGKSSGISCGCLVGNCCIIGGILWLESLTLSLERREGWLGNWVPENIVLLSITYYI